MPAAHPPEFRRRALDLVAQGNPVGQTARDLGISESCLRNWMNRDAVDSGRKAGVTTDEHKELVELRRRNRVLEMEIEILKRASAYFAREPATIAASGRGCGVEDDDPTHPRRLPRDLWCSARARRAAPRARRSRRPQARRPVDATGRSGRGLAPSEAARLEA